MVCPSTATRQIRVCLFDELIETTKRIFCSGRVSNYKRICAGIGLYYPENHRCCKYDKSAFSALTGKNTFIYAKKQADDFATAVGGANKNAKKLNQTLLGIDELNINNPDKNSGGSSGSGITGSDFEEKPIENKYKDLADKIKDFFSKLFAPLKEAWNREGQFVMDSWKYALDEVKSLCKTLDETS